MKREVIVKHHMLNTLLMGLGGSEYVALEIVLGLKKYGIDTCFKPLISRYTLKHLARIGRFYGIPRRDLNLLEICRNDEEGEVSINATGDFLSGSANIYYMHYPSMIKPDKYYPGITGWRGSILSYLYYLPNKYYMYKKLKKADAILVNSRKTALYIEKHVGVRTHVVYPPVNMHGLIGKPVIPGRDREKYLLVVSRISPEKQPFKILYVASALKLLGLKDWKVLMIGGRTKISDRIIKYILDKARRLELEKYIVIETNVERKKLNEYYRRAYAYIHLTDHEHFGITIIEAMAAGTPVIIPSNNNILFELSDRRNILLEYRNLRDLAKNIDLLVNDPDQVTIIGKRLKSLSKIFSRERFHSIIYHIVSTTLQ